MTLDRARTWSYPVVPLALLACVLAGCGGSQPAKKPSTSPPRIAPPQRRSDPIDEPEPDKPLPPQPTPNTPVGPWLEWQIGVADAPVVEGKSYLKLIVTPGYPTVLQLASYRSTDHEEFPSLFIRAVTPAKTLTDLVNRKLPARLAIMVDEDGHVIHNQETQTVEFVITEIDGKNIRGAFSGEVHDVDLGGNGPISGKFQAVVE